MHAVLEKLLNYTHYTALGVKGKRVLHCQYPFSINNSFTVVLICSLNNGKMSL
ncbi:MAG: hypothetical protein A4E55_02132 [Pelotomaculum sp. PtaU1.Bin035]|nr:MAG: hypothetical protein A4E55_02132 [Pelotomaculum sp. PtaU1.Bin035]